MENLLNRAMSILARRDHSEYELRRKLAAQFAFNGFKKRFNKTSSHGSEESPSKEELADQIESVVQYCYEYHWLDDEKFAARFIQSRSLKGYGRQKIKLELLQKGVSKDIVDNAFADCGVDWIELAEMLIDKHFDRQLMSEWKYRSKMYNYMVNKGFDTDEINKALKNSPL